MFASFRIFAADFARFSGSLGLRSAIYTLLGALLEGIGLMLLLPLVNVVSRAGIGSGPIDRLAAGVIAALPGRSPAVQLALLLGAFGVLMALRALVIFRRDDAMARLQTGFVEKLRLRIVAALSDADWRALSTLRHGRVSHVLSNDIRSCGLAAHLSLQSAIAAIMLVVQMTLALFLSPFVALLIIALLGGGALLLRPALARSRALGLELTDASFALTDDTNQFLGGLKLAFSQNLQDRFVAGFRRTLAFNASREVAFARQRTLAQIALTSLAAAVAAVALLMGFTVFATSASALIALLVVLARMSGPAAQLQNNLQYIAHSLPAYEAIRGLERDLAAAGRAEPVAATGSMVPLAGDIRLDGVAFAHGARDGGTERAAGLRGVDLVIEEGSFLGLAGSSGVGKTTLVDLLAGLIAPASGTISVGGRPLEGAALRGWRDRISYVSQDPFLFHDSIGGNLRWARSDATDDAIWRALALAGADDLVRKLPQGLATVVGERGSLVSGGERQRIALARALIRDPALLILDEATNAIDIEGERAILGRLSAMRPRPTIIMVAHREQSLALCDRVVTLDDGRIAADVPARDRISA